MPQDFNYLNSIDAMIAKLQKIRLEVQESNDIKRNRIYVLQVLHRDVKCKIAKTYYENHKEDILEKRKVNYKEDKKNQISYYIQNRDRILERLKGKREKRKVALIQITEQLQKENQLETFCNEN